nr:uncharacterized protein LOC109153444 [Ipomoea batatas]
MAAKMDSDIPDTMLAYLDLDALVYELINDRGITTEQYQVFAWDITSLGNINDGTAITPVQEHKGHEEIDLETAQMDEETAQMEDANAQREDENAHQMTIPCLKTKKVQVIRKKHAIKRKKYATRASLTALKSRFPPASVDDPFNID